ncbi:MAG TPA: CerR family C-terminal domain-containing protein [Caulobacter sp.]|nr:CerR family C-terminal domain-containing protein [Caulobacter sp.]
MPTAAPAEIAPLAKGMGARGYRKGDEARARILEAALAAFGAEGFKGATTRQIAEEAGVNLPALKYYFGGKEGLYRACAQEIVDRYSRRLLTPIAGAWTALPPEPSPDAARAALKAVLGALAELLVGTREAERWTGFVLREMTEPGPAFDILYSQVWAPGVELVAQLIGRILPGLSTEAARIEAFLLVSSLTSFSIVRPVALKYLDWPDATGERLAAVRMIVDGQVDRLGRG